MRWNFRGRHADPGAGTEVVPALPDGWYTRVDIRFFVGDEHATPGREIYRRILGIPVNGPGERHTIDLGMGGRFLPSMAFPDGVPIVAVITTSSYRPS